MTREFTFKGETTLLPLLGALATLWIITLLLPSRWGGWLPLLVFLGYLAANADDIEGALNIRFSPLAAYPKATGETETTSTLWGLAADLFRPEPEPEEEEETA